MNAMIFDTHGIILTVWYGPVRKLQFWNYLFRILVLYQIDCKFDRVQDQTIQAIVKLILFGLDLDLS